MKKLLLLIIALAGILQCSAQVKKHSVWTAAYEASVYRRCDVEAKVVIADAVVRRDYVVYMVERFKTELPKGVASIPNDSLIRMGMKFGKEYFYSHPLKRTDVVAQYTPWTPAIEQVLREAILRKWTEAELKNGNQFCDCYINKLKIIYPDKLLLPPPQDVIETAAMECKVQLKKAANGDMVWTAAYEAEGYKIINDQLKIFFPDSTARKDLATYMIKRYKAELPDGLEAITADSLIKLSQKIGVDYYAQHADEVKNLTVTPQPWTPAIEKGMRYGFLNEWSKKGLANGDQYCDCYIKALKTKYPDKIPLPPPHDVIEKVTAECKAELKTH